MHMPLQFLPTLFWQTSSGKGVSQNDFQPKSLQRHVKCQAADIQTSISNWRCEGGGEEGVPHRLYSYCHLVLLRMHTHTLKVLPTLFWQTASGEGGTSKFFQQENRQRHSKRQAGGIESTPRQAGGIANWRCDVLHTEIIIYVIWWFKKRIHIHQKVIPTRF
jgi:hypothetical protein